MTLLETLRQHFRRRQVAPVTRTDLFDRLPVRDWADLPAFHPGYRDLR